MQLTVELGGVEETRWAQKINLTRHYIKRKVHPQKRPITYTVCHRGERVGMIMVGIPHATRNAGWWGYPGLPTQWQVVDICRVWLEPAVQVGGALCHPDIVPGFIDRKGIWRPAAATWAVRQVMSRIQEDWISMWPPVLLLLNWWSRGALTLCGVLPSGGCYACRWRCRSATWKKVDCTLIQPD